MCSTCMAVNLQEAVNNIKPLSVAMGAQELIPSALLSGYKIFRAAVRNNNVLWSALKCPNLLSDFNQLRSISTDFRRSPKYLKFMEIRPVRQPLIHADRRTDMTMPTDTFSYLCEHA
jgi:hypothetical protein